MNRPLRAADIDAEFDRFCRTGDTDALGAVFKAVAPWLTQRAMRLVRDPLLAMDLVQATFVTAIEIRERFDPQGNVRSWLRGILENKARRRPAVRLHALPPDAEPFAHSDPAEQAMRAELTAIVQQGIDRLPEPYRAVLHRALLHEETAEQIAAALARPPATVRSQVRRGIERLRLSLPLLASALLRAMRGDWRITALVAGIAIAGLSVATSAWLRDDGPPVAPATTSTDGGAPTGSTATAATAPGDPTPGRLPVTRELLADEIEATPPNDLRIEVRRAIDQAVVPEVELVLQWNDGERQHVRTDARGIAGVARRPGCRQVVVELPFAGLRQTIELAAGTATATTATPSVAIVIPPGFAVAGDVVDAAGQPVTAATVLRSDEAGDLQVARTDDRGRFLVVDLRAGHRHRLRALSGSHASTPVELIGTAGTTQPQQFRLDRPWPDAEHAATQPVPSTVAATSLLIEFPCRDGASVHGWLAVLTTAADEDAIAVQPIAGDVARFDDVPPGDLRCALVPPLANDAGGATTFDARILTRRHGTRPRLLQRRGGHAVLPLRSDELPGAWLRVQAEPDAATLLAQRAVLLDTDGRPRGIFPGLATGFGPVRPGTWTIALMSPGHEPEYRGPLEVANGGVYTIPDMTAPQPAILRLRGSGGGPVQPPLQTVWLCFGEVLLTLEPRRDVHDDLRVAPGDFVLYWQQQGRACTGQAVHAESGAQDVELVAPPGREVTFLFDYGALPITDRMARLDLVVRDRSGAALWRERLNAPLDKSGQLRVVRRFVEPSATVRAVDTHGCLGDAVWTPDDAVVRITMRDEDRGR